MWRPGLDRRLLHPQSADQHSNVKVRVTRFAVKRDLALYTANSYGCVGHIMSAACNLGVVRAAFGSLFDLRFSKLDLKPSQQFNDQ